VARKTTASFVLELPLQTTAADDHSLAVRLYAARHRDLYSAYLARFVCNERLDASQAAKAWSGMEAFLRAASDNFEPVSGRDFALPHLTIGVRAGRSKNPGQKVRKAEDAVALVARASESGVIRSNPDVT
jgi:hypothetical protein